MGNIANTFGGGAQQGGEFENTLVSGNTAMLNGGGIQAIDPGIINSTISDNILVDDFFQGAGIKRLGDSEFGQQNCFRQCGRQ